MFNNIAIAVLLEDDLSYPDLIAEYCNGEYFEASCNVNEVIVVTSAVFGRMEIGRCVPEDLGFLGCQNDAVDTMDEVCSGQRSCRTQVITQEFRKEVQGACRNGLSGYAKITHRCQDGKYEANKSHKAWLIH